jgi:hypothetical protein
MATGGKPQLAIGISGELTKQHRSRQCRRGCPNLADQIWSSPKPSNRFRRSCVQSVPRPDKFLSLEDNKFARINLLQLWQFLVVCLNFSFEHVGRRTRLCRSPAICSASSLRQTARSAVWMVRCRPCRTRTCSSTCTSARRRSSPARSRGPRVPSRISSLCRAVTRGLDPTVAFRPSGVEWVGDVPLHWCVASLRFRYEQCLGKMVDPKQFTGKHLVPYLRNVDVRWDRINTDDLPLIDIAPHERQRFTVRVGDLLVCEGRHLGRCAFWNGELEVCAFQKALHRLRPLNLDTDYPRFLFYCMCLAYLKDAFHRNKVDNTIPHLTGEMLRAHRFAFPPIAEQKAIAAYLDATLGQVEETIAATRTEIGLLREYRNRLIADVVTGKLDVRKAAARLPDEVEEPEPLDTADAVIDGEEDDVRRSRGGRGVKTDTSEAGLERLICTALTGSVYSSVTPPTDVDREASAAIGGAGWTCGDPNDYDREYTVDLAQLLAFLIETQPEAFDGLNLSEDGPARRKFLARLQGEISRRGVIDVLRKGIKDGPHHVELFYWTPSPGNTVAAERNAQNRFSVTRQLRYSRDETQRALDLGLFINGLPIATFELKNSLTKQTVDDAVEQYKRDRYPAEKLFEFGRCIVHFAVDDHEVRFCTHPKGKGSWFLPFNLGWNDGAGNPRNPDGLKTDYLWKRLLTREGLTDILENYAQVFETKDERTGKKKAVQIWPRYHQLDVVHRLLADIQQLGAGQRYLIQHSAGSGKSNSIAWLAHQLIGMRRTTRRCSIPSSSSPTGASWTSRFATRSSSSHRWARRSATPSTRATCGSSSRAAAGSAAQPASQPDSCPCRWRRGCLLRGPRRRGRGN